MDCTKSVYDTEASHRYDPGTGRFSLYKTTEATLGYSANLKDLGKLAFFSKYLTVAKNPPNFELFLNELGIQTM